MWERFTDRIVELAAGTPLGRTVSMIVNTLVSGVIGNWWVDDMYVAGKGLDLSKANSSWASAAVLIYFMVVIIFFNKQHAYERSIMRWSDPKFVLANINQYVIPVLMEQTAERLRKGEIKTLIELQRELGIEL